MDPKTNLTKMENQISHSDHVVATAQISHSTLLAPNDNLLSVLKTVGAKGSWTPTGKELFSIRQLFEFLIAYIKKNLLYDPINPLVVYCKSDPLGKVFGVEKFTKQDALSLLTKNCMEVVSSPKVQQKIGAVPLSVHSLFISSDATHVSSLAPSINTPVPHFMISGSQSHSPNNPLKRHASFTHGYPESKRLKHDDGSSSSPSAGSESRRTRTRHPSLSIMYSDGDTGNGDYDWRLTFTALRVADTDTESVYSVQSKETTLARDSSDDYWFVDDEDDGYDDDDGEELDGISLQMGNEGFSLEFTQGEEYEVVSEESASEYDTDGSESPVEEIFVVYEESDEEFWADSESSDTDCETFSADEEISDEDKWTCITCGELNYPLRRNCDRCWALRSSWLPSKVSTKTYNHQSDDKIIEESCPEMVCDLDNKEKGMNCGQRKDIKSGEKECEIYKNPEQKICSSELVAKKAICEALAGDGVSKRNDSSQLKIECSMTGIHNIEDSVLNEVLETSNQCTSVLANQRQSELKRKNTVPISELASNPPLLKESSPESSTKRRRLLSRNDSGLGTSITTASTPTYHEFDSGISSQEMPKERDSFDIGAVKNTKSDPFECFTVLSPPDVASTQVQLFQRQKLETSSVHKSSNDSRSFKVNTTAKRRQRVSFSSSSDEKTASPSPIMDAITDQAATDSCMICLSKPKEASIIHGKTGHQVCCYVCAKRLKKKGKSCPVCRRPITKVIKNYLV